MGLGKPSTKNAPGFPPVPTASTAGFFGERGVKKKKNHSQIVEAMENSPYQALRVSHNLDLL
jgi:hypothetical protein